MKPKSVPQRYSLCSNVVSSAQLARWDAPVNVVCLFWYLYIHYNLAFKSIRPPQTPSISAFPLDDGSQGVQPASLRLRRQRKWS